MNIRQVIVVAGVAALVTGCIFKKKPGDEVRIPQPVRVEIENHNWNDIVVYALVQGTRHRLGSVGAVNRASLKVPEGIVMLPGSVELLLDPLGSRTTFRTGHIMVGLGQEVRLRVENELRLTSWTVQ